MGFVVFEFDDSEALCYSSSYIFYYKTIQDKSQKNSLSVLCIFILFYPFCIKMYL